MREKRCYRLTGRVLVAAGVVYVALALWRESTPHQDEIFPFASWSLFTLVPNQTHDYSLLILEVDGKPLAAPIYFERAWPMFTSTRSNGARMSIQRLGMALEQHNAAAAADERRDVEMIHLREHERVRYAVVARSYDAMKRWREGTIDGQQTLATFETSAGAQVADDESLAAPSAPPAIPPAIPTAPPDKKPGDAL